MAPCKLVVLSRAPGGAERDEMVDLAHEALTRLWPRLREWLAASRDFRRWQEQLRTDLHRWQAQNREPTRLLSGSDLAEADRGLAEHPEDISADERAYILLTAPRRIGTLPSRAVSVPFSTSYVTGPLAFDADGSRLAVQNTDGQVRVWDVGRRRLLPGGTPATGNDALIGFGPGHSVVVSVFGKDVVRIHDLTDDGASGTLPVAYADFVAGSVRKHRLTVDTGILRLTFDLRSDEQFRTLCAAVGRDYTDAERRLLPKGAPPEPPCD
ncbi:hypothetical protein ACF1BE_26185 [Streptomyces sp. NPDC014991]|uniref:nSTAND1 domain-containing NTPase n=1 Tax=Streptomyces sp. NPDC014991 TaxID=3364935 RepID=UPI003702298F